MYQWCLRYINYYFNLHSEKTFTYKFKVQTEYQHIQFENSLVTIPQMSEITAPMSRSLLFRQSHYFEKLCTLLKMFKKSEFVLFTDCCCTDVLISAVGSLQGDVHLLPHGVDISTSARCLVSDTRCLVSDTRCLVILELRR